MLKTYKQHNYLFEVIHIKREEPCGTQIGIKIFILKFYFVYYKEALEFIRLISNSYLYGSD